MDYTRASGDVDAPSRNLLARLRPLSKTRDCSLVNESKCMVFGFSFFFFFTRRNVFTRLWSFFWNDLTVCQELVIPKNVCKLWVLNVYVQAQPQGIITLVIAHHLNNTQVSYVSIQWTQDDSSSGSSNMWRQICWLHVHAVYRSCCPHNNSIRCIINAHKWTRTGKMMR